MDSNSQAEVRIAYNCPIPYTRDQPQLVAVKFAEQAPYRNRILNGQGTGVFHKQRSEGCWKHFWKAHEFIQNRRFKALGCKRSQAAGRARTQASSGKVVARQDARE